MQVKDIILANQEAIAEMILDLPYEEAVTAFDEIAENGYNGTQMTNDTYNTIRKELFREDYDPKNKWPVDVELAVSGNVF